MANQQISANLEAVFNIGVRARIVDKKVTNKRILIPLASRIDLAPACTELMEIVNEKKDPREFPNIHYARGLKLALRFEWEALIKRANQFIDGWYGIPRKPAKVRGPRKPVRAAQPQLEEIGESDISLSDIPDLPHFPEEVKDQYQLREKAPTPPAAPEVEDEFGGPISVEVFSAQLPELEQFRAEPEFEPTALPAAAEIAPAEVLPLPEVPTLHEPSVIEAPRLPDVSRIEPVQPAELQRAVQAAIVAPAPPRRRVSIGGRHRKPRAETLEIATAFYDDYHEVFNLETLEDVVEDDYCVMPPFRMIQYPVDSDAHAEEEFERDIQMPSALRAHTGIDIDDSALDMGVSGVVEAQPTVEPLHLLPSEISVEAPAVEITAQAPTILGEPAEPAEPSALSPVSMRQIEETVRTPSPQDILDMFDSSVPEAYRMGSLYRRLLYLVSLRKKRPNSTFTIRELTPGPHNALNIVTTFMLLALLNRWKMVKLTLEEKNYLLSITFL